MKKSMDKNCKTLNIYLRPAKDGIWCVFLLLGAYIMTMYRNPDTIQTEYKISTIICFGLVLQTIDIFLKLILDGINPYLKFISKLLPVICTVFLLWYCLKLDILFCIGSGVTTLFIYNFLYFYVLKACPKSFTLGEAAIVIQGFILFLYNFILQFPTFSEPANLNQSLNLILQIGLVAISILIFLVYSISFFRKWYMFYFLFSLVVAGVFFFPIENDFAVVIMFNFLFDDFNRSLTLGVYTLLLVLTGFTVAVHVKRNEGTSTSIRKVFHLFMVAVFVPGLIYQCTFLFVATVVIMCILIILEMARLIKLFPVSNMLESVVSSFIDEKDAGNIALTPIYLLVGCSLPLWIHNSPCDLTDSAGFEILPLLSGILSIGIGDTFAGVVGSKYGRHKWPNSKRSVEGTLASIVAQNLFIVILWSLSFVSLSVKLAAICEFAIIANALVESRTDQVDNLVLPILTYIILLYK